MSGTCKYCGFSGTNDQLAEHAGSCPVMTKDNSPTEEKLFKIGFCDLIKEKQEEFLKVMKLNRNELDERYLTGEIPIAVCKIDSSMWITEEEFYNMIHNL